jgi:prepilin-type N-terminal cleavage/methylation domain-containing protein
MHYRSGVTLVEVLVAIFVLGLGLLAILALFPLAALNMSQAIKDDRTGHAAANADDIAFAWIIRQDTGVQNAMVNPGYGGLPNLAGSPGQSYPVYVDPTGWVLSGGASPNNGVTNPIPMIPGLANSMPRQTLRFLNDITFDTNLPGGGIPYRNAQIMRWCTLLDDQTNWGDNGVPITVQFEQRYSWAYLLYMPQASTPTVVNLSVVVYSGRQQQLTAGGTPMGENTYQAVFNAGSTIVPVTWNPAAQEKPAIRRGGWICDATMQPNPHGYFYRVVGVTETGPGSMDVEVQFYPKASANPGVLLVLDNVVEVFDKGT